VKNKILEQLNEAQKEAVTHFEGPTLIIAGAGSGKTRVLTNRIAYMLEKNIHPARIMALTFTNKAADEMKIRIAQMVSDKASRYLWMGTFHSMFRKILKAEAEKLKFTSNFTIYDTDDSRSLIKNIIKELSLETERYKPNEIHSRISKAKNNLITAEHYKNDKDLIQIDFQHKVEKLWQIYEIYQHRLVSANAMDFDDLLLNTNILFRDFPDVLEKYQRIFDYILVDEYQDTNYSQYLIVRKLSQIHQNLCVVGDDSQSIYSFRGARIENILNFKKDYPQYQLFKLEQNYRSTQTIVNAANSLISHNRERIPKNVFSRNAEGEKIEILKALTETEEAYLIVKIVAELKNKDNSSYKEMAVLYRINAQSRVLEDAFRRFNIPYKIYGSLSFYQRKEIKDVLAYIRLCINHNDDEALKRIINIPARGIGPHTIEKIQNVAIEKDISMWNVLNNDDTMLSLVSNSFNNKLKQFVSLFSELSTSAEKSSAFEFIEELIRKSRIIEELEKEKTTESFTRKENIQELVNSIKDFEINFEEKSQKKPSISEFLDHVSLLSTIDEQSEKNTNIEKVTLMTAHSAKGLEFETIFIAGAEKKLFPLSFHPMNEQEQEEERRLFYVALTRAKQKVFITLAEQRQIWGNRQFSEPSPFINEIDPQYLSISFELEEKQIKYQSYNRQAISNNDIKSSIKLPSIGKKYVPLKEIQKNSSSSKELTEISQIKEGILINHERFGKGIVLKVEGESPNTRALIQFDMSGQKQLLLKYAKLTIL
jgi:DNA helicase-2/ATP-dependent DNA helicase PcrA